MMAVGTWSELRRYGEAREAEEDAQKSSVVASAPAGCCALILCHTGINPGA